MSETISGASTIVSVNFTDMAGDATRIDSDESYGISALGTVTDNWENLSASTNNLSSGAGTATTVDLTASGNFPYYNGAYADTPMQKGIAAPTTVTLSDLNATFPNGYIAVVYLTGFTGNDKASITDGSTTYYFQAMASPAAPISLVQTTDTLSADPTPEAQYAVFGSDEALLTADSISFTLTNRSGAGVAIGGIQLYQISEETVVTNNYKTLLSIPTRDAVLQLNPTLQKLEFSNLDAGLSYTVETSTDLGTDPSINWDPQSSFELESGSTRTEDYDNTAPKRFYQMQYPAKMNKRSIPLGN